jgi:hypothetical protein
MRWFEFGKLVVELVKAIAWPGVVLAIAWRYREQIVAQLSRITELGPTGVKLATIQVQVPAPSLNAATGIAQVRARFTEQVLNPALDAVRRDLASVADTDHDRIEVLAHALASMNIQYAFERVYREIFGSQVILLQSMQTTTVNAEHPALQAAGAIDL